MSLLGLAGGTAATPRPAPNTPPNRQFVLVGDVAAKPNEPKESALPALREALARGETNLSITGYVDGWVGRWPGVLQRSPERRPRLMVTGFESAEDE